MIAFSLMLIRGVLFSYLCYFQQNPHFIKGCLRAKQRQTPFFLSLPPFGSIDLSFISGSEKSLFFAGRRLSADLKSSPPHWTQGSFQ